eukprot:8846060-Pyramimonas_sp.AAC.1
MHRYMLTFVRPPRTDASAASPMPRGDERARANQDKLTRPRRQARTEQTHPPRLRSHIHAAPL